MPHRIHDGKLPVDGEGLRTLREDRGLTRARLAELAKTTEKTIRLMETSPEYRANPASIGELAKALDVKASRFVIPNAVGSHPQIIRTAEELIYWNTQIASSARRVLVCVGSRSRDVKYLETIEKTLRDEPLLVHYRVMSWPPFKLVFQQHLLRVLEIRNPTDRRFGEKKTHVARYTDLRRVPEHNFCVNETTGLIVLPSLHSVAEYNTALLIQEPSDVDALIKLGKTLYQLGDPLETKDAIVQLGLLPSGELYE